MHWVTMADAAAAAAAAVPTTAVNLSPEANVVRGRLQPCMGNGSALALSREGRWETNLLQSCQQGQLHPLGITFADATRSRTRSLAAPYRAADPIITVSSAANKTFETNNNKKKQTRAQRETKVNLMHIKTACHLERGVTKDSCKHAPCPGPFEAARSR